MTTKTTKELFLEASAAIVKEAVKSGSNAARIRALRDYMFETLSGVSKEAAPAEKAMLIGEMFSTHEVCGPAIVNYAKEKAKFEGTPGNANEVALAMVAIESVEGIYSPTSGIWGHCANRILAADKAKLERGKCYPDVLRALRAELRAIADKANQQMNAILTELGIKEPSKKGGKGGKNGKDGAPTDSASPSEMNIESYVAANAKDTAKLLNTFATLVESMLAVGVPSTEMLEIVQAATVVATPTKKSA